MKNDKYPLKTIDFHYLIDLIHVPIQLAVKIQNVLQVDNVHCADVSEDSLEIQTAGNC